MPEFGSWMVVGLIWLMRVPLLKHAGLWTGGMLKGGWLSYVMRSVSCMVRFVVDGEYGGVSQGYWEA